MGTVIEGGPVEEGMKRLGDPVLVLRRVGLEGRFVAMDGEGRFVLEDALGERQLWLGSRGFLVLLMFLLLLLPRERCGCYC